MSLPLRGAWIEIPALTVFRFMMRCRSPCGERGLKSLSSLADWAHIPSLPLRGAWIEIYTDRNYCVINFVAPPAGSVD